ncbi:MAG: hypothetical protein MK098_11485 [Marinovum sp.]|nr:hypothetical protein [Marinovum sp.]
MKFCDVVLSVFAVSFVLGAAQPVDASVSVLDAVLACEAAVQADDPTPLLDLPVSPQVTEVFWFAGEIAQLDTDFGQFAVLFETRGFTKEARSVCTMTTQNTFLDALDAARPAATWEGIQPFIQMVEKGLEELGYSFRPTGSPDVYMYLDCGGRPEFMATWDQVTGRVTDGVAQPDHLSFSVSELGPGQCQGLQRDHMEELD